MKVKQKDDKVIITLSLDEAAELRASIGEDQISEFGWALFEAIDNTDAPLGWYKPVFFPRVED